MSLTYLDFELEIGIGEGREFSVSARSPAGEARTMMRFPYDELALESRLKDLHIALLRSGDTYRQILPSEQQAVRNFGQVLFDFLFAGEVRNRYDVSLQQARNQGKGLRIRLQVQSPMMAALPWEYLYDPRQIEYCCLSVETPLVRYLELPRPISPLAVTPPLRILGLVVSPSDLPELDVNQERQRIEQAVKHLRAEGRIELEWLPGQTWRDLQGALRRGPWHIFHFSGHGLFDTLTDEGQLAFADDRGRTHLLSASDVGRLLANHSTLRLAWLNACEGAHGGESDIFSSTASMLVRRGIPAVVAMQYPITDRAAIELARTFYEAVADGYPVDAALAEARMAVSLAVKNSVEWGTPVLYMRAPDGVLFELAGQAKVPQTPIETRIATEAAANPMPEAFRLEAYEEALPETADQPVSRLSGARTVREPRRRSRVRVLLSIAGLAIVVGFMIILANRAGVFPRTRLETATVSSAGWVGVTETAEAQAQKTRDALIALNATATASAALAPTPIPVATLEPTSPPLFLTGNAAITDEGIILTKPFTMTLVRVPRGVFPMGSDPLKDVYANADEQPQHNVDLAEYYVGKYEVTKAQYQAFVHATGHKAPSNWENGSIPPGKENHPVTLVSWNDAVAFTNWLSATTGIAFGLPTEAQWEKTCRGTDGRLYPWGNTDPNPKVLNFDGNTGGTSSVGSYSAQGDSPYGVADLAGNAWEWVADRYNENYYVFSPTDNPQGPNTGNPRVLRGGSYGGSASEVRCTDRLGELPYNSYPSIGFRVAWLPAMSDGQLTPEHPPIKPEVGRWTGTGFEFKIDDYGVWSFDYYFEDGEGCGLALGGYRYSPDRLEIINNEFRIEESPGSGNSNLKAVVTFLSATKAKALLNVSSEDCHFQDSIDVGLWQN